MELVKDANLKESGRKTIMTQINSLTSAENIGKLNIMMDRAERSYYLNRLHDNRFYIKKIYAICNDLLGRRKEIPLPLAESKQELTNRFNQFFTEKVQKIRDHLMELVNDNSFTPIEVMDDNTVNTTSTKMEVFHHVSLQEVIETIMKSPTKSCEHDLMSMELIKDSIETISPLIQIIATKPFSEGVFPDDLKKTLL